MNNKLPKALTDRQEQQRQQTINRVLHALDYLDSCGMGHTVKNLVEVTGLSRSVFSKPHVRELVENYRSGNDSPTEEQRKAIQKKQKRDAEVKKLRERIESLTAENAELKHQNELLRGQNYLLLKKIQVD